MSKRGMNEVGKGRKVASRGTKKTAYAMSTDEDMGMGKKVGRAVKRVSRTSTRTTSSSRKGGRKVTRRSSKK